MSRQFRHRATGLGLAVFVTLAPLLAAEAAGADPVAANQEIVFAGGGMFSCVARPDVESLQVPADSTVRLVNNTGHGVDLLLDGESQGGIPENSSTEVVFRRGTVAVSLDPDCVLGAESAPVLVTSSPSPTPSSSIGPIPWPTGSASVSPSPSDSTSSSPSPTPSRTTHRPRPTHPTRSPGSPGPSKTAHPPTPQQSTTATVRPTRTGAPPTTYVTPRDLATEEPTSAPTTAQPTRSASRTAVAVPTRSTEPTDDAPLGAAASLDPDDSAVVDLAPEPADPASSEAAAEPVAALKPLPRPSSVGLLALTAAVCVTGVMAGLIRAIATQRATRAKMA